MYRYRPYFLIFSLLLLQSVLPEAKAGKADSLITLIKNAKEDTSKVNHLNALAWMYAYINPDSAMSLSTEALNLSSRLKWPMGVGVACHQLGAFNNDRGNYPLSLQFYAKAMNIWDSLFNEVSLNSPAKLHGIRKWKALSIGNLGNVFVNQGEYPRALDHYLQALKLNEEMVKSPDSSLAMDGKREVARNLGAIAGVYLMQKDYPKSLEYYSSANKMAEGTNISKMIRSTWLGNTGIVYYELKDYQKAMEFHKKALEIDSALNNKNGLARHYGNLALVYGDQPDADFLKQGLKPSDRFPIALSYYFKALDIGKELGDQERIAIQYGNIGTLYTRMAREEENVVLKLSHYNNAEEFLLKSVKLSEEIGDLYGVMEVNLNLSELYRSKVEDRQGNVADNYSKAYEHYKKYSTAKDSIFNAEKNSELTRHELTYEFDKKTAAAKAEQEKKDAVAAAVSRKQMIVIVLTIFVLLIVSVSAGFILKSLRVTRRQKEIIEKQKSIVDKKNTQITDSITYAQTIQESILPKEKQFRNAFTDSFILYLPKDIVSGDFYWIRQMGDEVLLAAVDCTGHGVPGAFMSLHGYNHLENIVNDLKVTAPEQVLDELNKAVVETLNQDDGSELVKHGMDMSILKLNKRTGELLFSAAKNEGFIVSNGDILELKADRISVGNKLGKNFTVQRLTLKKGDMIYLFSDGFADQKGGPLGKRISSAEFKALLTKCAGFDCAEQKKMLRDAFFSWKGSNEQLDDVMVVGVRV